MAESLRNVLLIAGREYLERVRTKAFIFSTILLPAIMGGAILLPTRLAMRATRPQNIVVVASDPDTAAALKQGLEDRQRGLAVDFNVTVDLNATDAEHQQLLGRIQRKELDGVLWATSDALAKRELRYETRETSDFAQRGSLTGAITSAMMRRTLQTRGLTGNETDELFKPYRVDVVDAVKGSQAAGAGAFIGAIILMMMLYLTTLIYGVQVQQSVIEEKTSRVMEVLLSSTTSTQLLGGKILGVGSVGLTQLLIWVLLGVVTSSPAVAAVGGAMKGLSFSATAVVFFPVFFLLGYFLYSTIFAALGSMVNSQQEVQSLQTFVMLPLISSTIVMMPVIRAPNSPMAVAFSMFPFTAPLIMYLRIVIQQPPMIQIVISVALLALTIYGMLWLAARIYRVGILMYGKKPTLPEIVKWVKYA
ncbi:MAG TPA: ABC transporter permease [Terriglobales bacterium]|nr:ABC transporter permease [Terriglobales bacterium]